MQYQNTKYDFGTSTTYSWRFKHHRNIQW